jgi:hypothetical protein
LFDELSIAAIDFHMNPEEVSWKQLEVGNRRIELKTKEEEEREFLWKTNNRETSNVSWALPKTLIFEMDRWCAKAF